MKHLNIALVAVIGALLASVAASSARADAYHTPNGAERKAIMNAVRPRVEHDLHQSVIFVVSFCRAESGWVMMEATPTRPDGGAINWDNTQWKDAYDHGAWGGEVDVLLHKRSGSWHIVAYVLGASDVTYVDWPQQYGCPSRICHLGGGN